MCRLGVLWLKMMGFTNFKKCSLKTHAPIPRFPRTSSQWRHNGRHIVSNHQPHDCLPNRLSRHLAYTSLMFFVLHTTQNETYFNLSYIVLSYLKCQALNMYTDGTYNHPTYSRSGRPAPAADYYKYSLLMRGTKSWNLFLNAKHTFICVYLFATNVLFQYEQIMAKSHRTP